MEKPTPKTPTIDWCRVIEPLGLGLFCQPVQKSLLDFNTDPLYIELNHAGIQNGLDVLSSVRNLVALRGMIQSKDTAETISTECLFVHTDRCLSSIVGLLSLALSPASTDIQRKQASDGLSMLLPSVIAESLSMAEYASSKTSSSPGDTSGITKNLAGSFFDPIIRSFIPVSRSIFLVVPPSTPTTVSGTIPPKLPTSTNKKDRGIGSKSQRYDIRPSLLATIRRTLDSLRFIRPDLASPLCLLTSLSIIPELRGLWFASTVGVGYKEVGSTQRRANRSGTRDEKEAFEKQRMQDLADHDAAWYLLTILNLCFEPSVLPISATSSQLIALLKIRLTHELTELARILCFSDRAQRITTRRAGSGPSLVEEKMVLDVYEKAWLNGWLDGPAYPETVDPTIGPLERTADMGGKEKGVGDCMEVQE